MSRYSYAFSEEAVAEFCRLSFRQRRQLLRVCERMTAYPHGLADYLEPGATGRIYQVKLVEDLLITWWTDDAARELRFVRLEKID